MRPYIKWTADCQGKQDYDGPIIDISTRYWPRGGGLMIFENGIEQPTNNSILPSAKSSILFRFGNEIPHDGDGGPDYVTIREQDFEGETEEIVKAQVENWVRKQYLEIAKIFGITK